MYVFFSKPYYDGREKNNGELVKFKSTEKSLLWTVALLGTLSPIDVKITFADSLKTVNFKSFIPCTIHKQLFKNVSLAWAWDAGVLELTLGAFTFSKLTMLQPVMHYEQIIANCPHYE